MENQAVDALALAGSVNYDMTIWGLFLEADIVVKMVLVLLQAASFWTWAVIFEKGHPDAPPEGLRRAVRGGLLVG